MSERNIKSTSQPSHEELDQEPESEVIYVDKDQVPPDTQEPRATRNLDQGSSNVASSAPSQKAAGHSIVTAAQTPTKKLTADLKPHPINAEIYGREPVDPELVNSIRLYGIQEAPIVSPDGTIISGHRRISAAKSLKIEEIEVIVKTFAGEEETKLALIESNRQRKKSNEALAREAKSLMAIEAELAKKRQQAGSSKESAKQKKNGKARDHVGEALGLSGVTANKSIEVVNAIDTLIKDGKNDEAAAIRAALEKSIESGHQKSVSMGLIKAAKKAANPKKKNAHVPVQTPISAQPVEVGTSTPKSSPQSVTSQGNREDPPSPYPNCGPLEFTTHGQAISGLDAVTSFLEDLDQRNITDRSAEEWSETVATFIEAYKDTGMRIA